MRRLWIPLAALVVVTVGGSGSTRLTPHERFLAIVEEFDREKAELDRAVPRMERVRKRALQLAVESVHGTTVSDNELAAYEISHGRHSPVMAAYARIYNAMPAAIAFREQVDRVQQLREATDKARAEWVESMWQ